jgi:hypothetical protein
LKPAKATGIAPVAKVPDNLSAMAVTREALSHRKNTKQRNQKQCISAVANIAAMASLAMELIRSFNSEVVLN